MARTEESNQRIREEQKRKILVAATKVFARKGLAGTRMADIAAEAGVGYGLVYHYFESKEVIFRAAVERGTGAFERLINDAQEQPGTPWERLYRLSVIILDGLRRVPEGFLVTQQAFVSDTVPQDIKEEAIRQARRSSERLQQLITEGQALGQVVAGNPGELTTLYLSCVGGIAYNFNYFGIPEKDYPHPESLLRLLKP